MGNCASFDSTQQEDTAKVVIHDGTMQEFSYPVKVSYLLQLYPSCFICDSDELQFDDVVLPMPEDEVLSLGQLYFALPLTRLKSPLQAVEIAALAVKANSALNRTGTVGDKCGFRRKQIVMFSGEGKGKPCRRVVPETGNNVAVSIVRSRSGRRSNFGGGRGKFMAALSAIPE
ncbi:uncharacterized protein [Cicer arietinum]|uniref:Uncharacterized protein LOC101503121 n=1 Tax=Cicer arietinum TaxID=3827 RepID=A0A1S2YSJ1_CICAR|nr:uncharacterized protein LOC101503121 [Cicer arietinum]